MNQTKRIPFAVEGILTSSILFGLVVAVLSPQTILTDHPGLQSFTDFVASIIPGIGRIEKVSNFPEVTRFVSAVLWATVPIQAILLAYPRVLIFRLELIKQKKKFAFLCWLAAPLLVLMFSTMPFREPSVEELVRKDIYHWGLRSVSESRFWLGVIGGLVAYSAAALVFTFFAWWPRTWTVYFKN